jgi:hypothetical protein
MALPRHRARRPGAFGFLQNITGPIISEIVKCQYLLILTVYEKWLQVIHTVAKEGGLISWPKPFTHATDIKKGVGVSTEDSGAPHRPTRHYPSDQRCP